MSFVVDIALLLLFIILVATAAKKGFALSLLEVAAMLLAAIAAFALSTPAAEYVYDNFAKEPITAAIEEHLPEDSAVQSYKEQASAVLEGLPEIVTRYAAKAGLDADTLAKQLKESSTSGKQTAAELEKSAAHPIVVSVIKVLLFLLMFILFAVLLRMLAKYLSKVFKLPVLKTMNAALGAALGAVKGAMVVFILSVLLVFAARYIGGQLETAVSASRVAAFCTGFLNM